MQAVGEGETLGFLQEVRSREELHEFCLSVIYNFLAVLAQILVEHSFWKVVKHSFGSFALHGCHSFLAFPCDQLECPEEVSLDEVAGLSEKNLYLYFFSVVSVAAELSWSYHINPRATFLISEQLSLRVDTLPLRKGHNFCHSHHLVELGFGHGAEILWAFPKGYLLLYAALAQPISVEVLLVVKQYCETGRRHGDCIFCEFVHGNGG